MTQVNTTELKEGTATPDGAPREGVEVPLGKGAVLIEPTPHIAQFFAFAHLPERLQKVSKPFGELANFILTLPENPERAKALDRLLEAKDAAVRAVVAKLVILAVLFCALAPAEAFAIDSLLEKAAKAEKERVEKSRKASKKGSTAAVIRFSSGEEVRCAWLARSGENFQYERADNGRLVTSPQKDIVKLEGKVLDAAPLIEARVLHMYCDGRSCEPKSTTIHVPAWPSSQP